MEREAHMTAYKDYVDTVSAQDTSDRMAHAIFCRICCSTVLPIPTPTKKREHKCTNQRIFVLKLHAINFVDTVCLSMATTTISL